MLAGCFIIQLWEDGVAAKEHCERTFGKEGDSPSEYLHIKELEENVQTDHIVLLRSYSLTETYHHIFIHIEEAVEQDSNFGQAHDSILCHVTNPPEKQ